ncbi:hypothetical protein HanRHA438_Chr11g0487371 [Helianthus annuus]|nr:hypothetical protein HanIR_Chr11g0510651 [Helianthus annuus]KAJ0869275.1 hypothetical protein HanRHA438_Chr11g0487371 [Helianthus annuus]
MYHIKIYVVKAHAGARLGPLFRPNAAFSLRFKSPAFRPSGAFCRPSSDKTSAKNHLNRSETIVPTLNKLGINLDNLN